ncbi:NAD(P)-dependent oxidoreductase [Paenibacillus ferrarius]|uniref:NAD(P)-dependent oxidoreductase n=1 Tax=Paenibacillus ferrarius TaxID=1469647 RepID=UPI003D2BF2E0
MRIAILGATGRVGRRVLALALADGHGVTALVRDPAKIERQPSNLTLIQGDACQAADVLATVSRADTVISCLSTGGAEVLSTATPLLVGAMGQAGVRRVVTVGTAGILRSREHPALLRYETPDTRRSSTRAAEEHRRAWEALAASGLCWTVVCPTYLPEGEPQNLFRAERDYLPDGGTSITTGDTAAFTYRAALDDAWAGCRVGLAY